MAEIKDKFLARKAYDEDAQIESPALPSLYTKYYLDSWNIIPLYGKVDTLGVPILPKRQLMSYCTYAKDNKSLFVVDPAKEFFKSFREQYLDYYSIGAFNKTSNFFKKDIPPEKAYIDGDIEFTEKLNQIYLNFVEYLKISNKSRLSKLWETNASNKIKNFEDLFNEFINFLTSKNLYFTRAGYVESIDYSLLHSGLAIEIYNGNSSDDAQRKEFFDDVNFSTYLELCLRNNLKIDREVPWRVYIDIRTKNNPENTKIEQLDFESTITKYISKYKNVQNFFDQYYTRAVPYDDISFVYFYEFINTVNALYQSFTRDFPNYKFYLINQCGKAKVEKFARSNLPNFTIKDYLDLYLRIRNAELNKVVDNELLNNLRIESVKIYDSFKDSVGFKLAVIYAVKHYTNNIGTLAYRNPSLYELDEKQKMT